jgi:hypothetical protein
MEMRQAKAIDVNHSATQRANDGLQMMKCSLGSCRDMNRSSRAPDPDVVASTLGSGIWKWPPGRGAVYAARLASTVSISAQERQRKTS